MFIYIKSIFIHYVFYNCTFLFDFEERINNENGPKFLCNSVYKPKNGPKRRLLAITICWKQTTFLNTHSGTGMCFFVLHVFKSTEKTRNFTQCTMAKYCVSWCFIMIIISINQDLLDLSYLNIIEMGLPSLVTLRNFSKPNYDYARYFRSQ